MDHSKDRSSHDDDVKAESQLASSPPLLDAPPEDSASSPREVQRVEQQQLQQHEQHNIHTDHTHNTSQIARRSTTSTKRKKKRRGSSAARRSRAATAQRAAEVSFPSHQLDVVQYYTTYTSEQKTHNELDEHFAASHQYDHENTDIMDFSSDEDLHDALGIMQASGSPGPYHPAYTADGAPSPGHRVHISGAAVSPVHVQYNYRRQQSPLSPASQSGPSGDGTASSDGTDFSSYDDNSVAATPANDLTSEWNCDSCVQRVRRFTPSVWLFLALLGASGALVSYSVDRCIILVYDMKESMADTDSYIFNYLVWILLSIAFACIATACCHFLSVDAQGSGIPEMKAYLGGATLDRYLSVATLLAKIIGIVFAIGAGLYIGKEGPFVHIASCLANVLMQLPLFRHISRNPALKRQVFAAAVSMGVTMAFAAPVGGVLFAIEVTATYFLVSNLWKSFFTAAWCVLVLKMFHSFGTVELFDDTDFDRFSFGWELVAHVFLGILCGMLGALFIYASWFWLALKAQALKDTGGIQPGMGGSVGSMRTGSRSRTSSIDTNSAHVAQSTGIDSVSSPDVSGSSASSGDRLLGEPSRSVDTNNSAGRAARGYNSSTTSPPASSSSRLEVVRGILKRLIVHRYWFTAGVAGMLALISYPLRTLRETDRSTTNDMFQATEFGSGAHQSLDHWTAPSLFLNLAFFAIIKGLGTSLSISLPVPAGVLTPVFAIGAVIGRFYGELLRIMMPSYGIVPGTYAIVGAASLSAGVTHTLSITIIVFELTGQLHHMLPVLVAVLISYSLASGLALSIYDLILRLKGLPYLPSISKAAHGKLAENLLKRNFGYITHATSYGGIMDVLVAHPYSSFPCVLSDSDRLLIGTTPRHVLANIVRSRVRKFKSRLSGRLQRELEDALQSRAASRYSRTEVLRHPLAFVRDIADIVPTASGTDDMATSELTWRALKRGFLRMRNFITNEPVVVSGATAGDSDVTLTEYSQLHDSGAAEQPRVSANAASELSDSKQPMQSVGDVEMQFDTYMRVKLDFGSLPPTVVDRAPFEISVKTPVARVHFLFAMLGLEQVMVTREGRLHGVITKDMLLQM
jgi:H+/Cl- antiporter ClcA